MIHFKAVSTIRISTILKVTFFIAIQRQTDNGSSHNANRHSFTGRYPTNLIRVAKTTKRGGKCTSPVLGLMV